MSEAQHKMVRGYWCNAEGAEDEDAEYAGYGRWKAADTTLSSVAAAWSYQDHELLFLPLLNELAY